jgi:hypothetical protein
MYVGEKLFVALLVKMPLSMKSGTAIRVAGPSSM